MRAATIMRSAVCPSTTNALSPLSRKPLPERTACILGHQRAMVPCPRRRRARPATSRRRSSADVRPSARRCRRATERKPPARRSTKMAMASGCGRSPPSPRLGFDAAEPGLPPKSSGTSRPENPISAKVFQRSRENPVKSFASRSCRRCDTGALSLMSPRALSRSIDCSSLRTSAIFGKFRLRVLPSLLKSSVP